MAETLRSLPETHARPANPLRYARMMQSLLNYQGKGGISNVCEGTNRKHDLNYYLQRKRNVGDLHGQAPLLWCVSAFLR
jgi:hypothetical protein